MKTINVYPYRKRPMTVLVRGPLAAPERVETAHGALTAAAGDYVCSDPRNGDQWPIKQHFLAANYEPIDPSDEARFKTMRQAIFVKIAELAAIAIRGSFTNYNGQIETLLLEYGDANKRAGGESVAGQMRSSFLALGDEVADMQKTGAISPEAAERMAVNIKMLIELFAPASDTRRAVFGYQNGQAFDWEDKTQ